MRRWARQTFLLMQVAVTASVLAFFFFLRQGQVLLYGDAVAHLNIARRIFDSRNPGPLQLGTVWLPLPHLVMMPFLVSDWMWQSGFGASIPSLLAYVLGVLAVFRLVRAVFGEERIEASVAGWIAALVYAANPNLLYLQSTAMTEPLYLCLFLWALVYFAEFVRESPDGQLSRTALIRCGLCVVGASLTRYDGWFLAVALTVLTAGVSWRRRSSAVARKGLLAFALLAAAGPLLWIGYNSAVYKNPLEFATGQYSARAIDQRGADAGIAPRPGTGSLKVATTYFIKSAELNLEEGAGQKVWILVLLAGILAGMGSDRRRWPLLLLLLPLPFYALSIAYGGVPIYVPGWWPFSYYNVRYGLELLPAFAVFSGVLVGTLLDFTRALWMKVAVVALAGVLGTASYVAVWRAQPVSLREAIANSRTRIGFEHEVAAMMRNLPASANILMYMGQHAAVMQDAGIPFRRTINEGNHRTWKQPADPEGLWEKALREPAKYVDFVVAFAGDPIWMGVNRNELTPLTEIHGGSGERVVIFKTRAAQ